MFSSFSTYVANFTINAWLIFLKTETTKKGDAIKIIFKNKGVEFWQIFPFEFLHTYYIPTMYITHQIIK